MREPLIDPAFLSPSLVPADQDRRRAFELKVVVGSEEASKIERWAEQRLTRDPHGDPSLSGAYHTTTLYLDTPNLDVFHRAPGYARKRMRVRRYGDAGCVFLERKARRNDRVSKRRTSVAVGDLSRFSRPQDALEWPGSWFQARQVRLGLQPSCVVEYTRSAFAGSCVDGPMRLTIDRFIRGSRPDGWRVERGPDLVEVLPGQTILELKFAEALPGPFKELVAGFRLSPEAFSKYRACWRAWGMEPRKQEPPRAGMA